MTKNTTSAFLSVLRNEVNFIFHDRYMKILLFIVPAFLLIFVSAMFSNGVPEKIPVALVDNDHSSLSREIIKNIDASKSIELVETLETVAQAQHLMKSMQIYAFVEIPRGASGASFPEFNMPGWVLIIMEIFPSTTMVSGFTMLNSQGANIHELMPVIIKISLLAIILFLLALYRLVWRKSHATAGGQ